MSRVESNPDLRKRKSITQGNALGSPLPEPSRPETAEENLTCQEGFDVFRLSGLPDDWRMATLRSVAARIFGGGTPSTTVPEYWDGSIPWTTSAVLGEEDIYLTKHQRCITEFGLDQSSSQLVPAGSVLIGTRVGVGKTAVTSCDIAISQDLTALVPKPKAFAEFLALALKCPPLAMWFEENKRGTTIKGVSRSDVLRLMVPLPPLPEQQAIAGVLRRVKRAKEACEQVLVATRQLKQSLLHHLFTYGHVPFPQADQVAVQDTDVGLWPGHWRRTTIGGVCRVLGSGITPRGGSATYLTAGIPLIRSQNVLMQRIVLADVAYISPETHAAMARSQVSPGDVLLNITGASIGRVAHVPAAIQEANVNQHVCRIRLLPDVAPEFLAYFLGSKPGQRLIFGAQHGATRQGLNYQQVRAIPIPLPPLSEQREIAAQLAAVDAKLAAEESRRAALAALFQSLLHHLMTGQVRVPLECGGKRSATPLSPST